MRTNTFDFNNSEEKLFELAKNRKINGDLAGALNTLLTLVERGSRVLENYALIGEIYTEMGLFAEATHYWFRYLSYAPKTRKARAYNALAANFIMSGEYSVGAYYFERQLENVALEDEYKYDEYLFYFFDDKTKEKPRFYIAYPPEEVKSDDLFDECVKLIENDDYDKAIEKLSLIKIDDKNYIDAQLKIATCLVVKDQPEKSIEVVNRLISDFPSDKTLRISLIGLLVALSKKDEAKEQLKLIENEEFDELDENYKLGIIYCDLGNSLMAEKYLSRAHSLAPFDVNITFILAIATYNLGKVASSRELFSMCYQVTRNPIARYYVRLCDEVFKNQALFSVLDFSLALPKNVANEWLEECVKIIRGGKKAVRKADKKRLIELAEWLALRDKKLADAFSQALILSGNAQLRKYYLNLLLSPATSDGLKISIIESLVYMGFDKKIGVVFGQVYIDLQLLRAEFDKENEVFKFAYALAFAKIAPFENAKAYKIRDSAYKIYYALESNGKLRQVSDINALAAVIALTSGLKIASKKSVLVEFFMTDRKKINEISELINEDS